MISMSGTTQCLPLTKRPPGSEDFEKYIRTWFEPLRPFRVPAFNAPVLVRVSACSGPWGRLHPQNRTILKPKKLAASRSCIILAGGRRWAEEKTGDPNRRFDHFISLISRIHTKIHRAIGMKGCRYSVTLASHIQTYLRRTGQMANFTN